MRGDSHVDCASLSDPVLVREDGTYLYTLPSVADDIDLKVTHVIRGEDHVTNTAVQIQIFGALGARAPVFVIFPFSAGCGPANGRRRPGREAGATGRSAR